MLLENERYEIVEYGKKMSLDRLSTGTSGNISIYNSDKNLVAISPSGIGYFDIQIQDVVIITLDGKIIDGDKKPSSEWRLHTAMYKLKKSCKAVVHTHSMYCTVFSALHQPLRAVHYVIGDSASPIVPCAPYRTFASPELANVAAETIGDSNAVLLANHGMLSCGTSLKSAYSLACSMEFCAEVQYRAMCIGNPVVIDNEEINRVIEKFKNYGQK